MNDLNVVVIENSNLGGDVRPSLESIENMDFGSENHIVTHLERVHGINPKSVSIYTISDFMDAWNNTDSDNQHLNIGENFIGYVRIIK